MHATACILLFGMCLAPSLRGQDVGHMRFERLTVEDGLSQGVVTAMLHDHSGFMWFGTKDGLNRYDGYTFVQFRNESDNVNSLGDNAISALVEDSLGQIWIGTEGGGLHRYDPQSRRVHRLPYALPEGLSEAGRIIRTLCFDSRGVLWIGTDGEGLFAYNPADSSVQHFLGSNTSGSALLTNSIHVIQAADRNHLWIGGHGNIVYLFDILNGSFKHFRLPVPGSGLGPADGILDLATDEENQLWVATTGFGVFRIDRETGNISSLDIPSRPEGSNPLFARALMVDSNQRLWIGTEDHGIVVYHLRKGRWEFLKSGQEAQYHFGDIGILTLLEDRIGNIWVGTNGKGLQFTSPASKDFHLLRTHVKNPSAMTIRSYRGIWEEGDSVLWLGGYGGLNRWDRKTGLISVVDLGYRSESGEAAAQYSRANAHCFCPDPSDPDGGLYVGSEGGGLFHLDLRSRRVRRVPAGYADDSHALRGFSVYDMIADDAGNLYIATDIGMSRYQTGTGRFTHYIHDPQNPHSINSGGISTLYRDSNGFLWIGSERGGLGLFDPVTEDFTRFVHRDGDRTSLSSNRVYSIYEDIRGVLWIGTSLGLNRMDRQSTTFRHFNRLDNFPNEVIYGILQDEQGLLWLSTNEGLVVFHPYRGVISTYDVSDGLQGNEFNSSAYFEAANGEMFFGGVNGLTFFHPKQIRRNPFIPPVQITNCHIGGKEVQLAQNAEGEYSLEFQYTGETISFEYAALSFYRSEKNQYRYRMDGVHEGWMEAGHNRQITFVALSPGEYTLHILGSNNDGIWNNEGVQVAITVLPPFWGSWWFRLLVGVLVLGIALLILRWRLSIIRKQEVQLTKTVEDRTAELRHSNASLLQEIEERKRAEAEAYRANATKTEFLAHLSHEIRTPMNAILGYTELLSDRIEDPELKDQLHSIELSGNSLLRLINDILDLSKIEAGRLELEFDAVDLRALLHEIQTVFEFQFQRKDLHFEVRVDEQLPQTMYIDELRTRQILFNLIGNAVKYTDEGGITVHVSQTDRTRESFTLVMTVSDTGIGIPPAQQEIVFEPFRQAKRARLADARGSGLGLAITRRLIDIMQGSIQLQSKVGQGSTFRIRIPDIRFPEEEAEQEARREGDAERDAASARPATVYTEDVRQVTAMDSTQDNSRQPDSAEHTEETISEPRRLELSAFLQQLRHEDLPLWQDVSRSYHIQQMEQFAQHVHDAASSFAYTPLVEWSGTLLAQVKRFDMEHIPRTLEKFPDLLENLAAQCQNA
ncbi:hypothetical protein KQI65_05360 [bacterium]|nr:hypothetical protein [bacterium]